MSTVANENFDGVTAPAIPTGWVAAANMQTTTTSFNSSPNGVHNVANLTVNFIYFNTSTDGNGGDARNTTLCWATATNITCDVRVYCRVTVPATTTGTETGYWVLFDLVGNGVSIQKTAAGVTGAALASSTGPTFGTTDKYYVTCETVGTLITCRIQRLSDSKWLKSDNTWQAAQQDYLTATDSTITGVGKCMVGARRFNSSDLAYFDDVLFETVGSGPSTRRMTQVISF